MSTFLVEPFGRRIARLRTSAGLTQQAVAERLALSRNAVSHLETGLSHPSERTVVLLAGLFGIEPHDLVSGTDYPSAKADRLPAVAPRHSHVEARLLAVAAEVRWIALLPAPALADAVATVVAELDALASHCAPAERAAVRAARREVAGLVADGRSAAG